MKISKIIFAIAIVSIFTITSCEATKPKSETTEVHSHEHDADETHVGEENPRLDHTIWTDKTELFVEFPALTVQADLQPILRCWISTNLFVKVRLQLV